MMILAFALLSSTISGLADEPRPAVVVRLDHPDRQALALIRLFRGARAPHPAAALAAWKQASADPNRLGKPAEALIAAINPAMAGELRSLEGAGLFLRWEPKTERPSYGASLPADDGTFAALATSLVLSGGSAGRTPEGSTIDRLGPVGSPLMTRGFRALLIGSSPGCLAEAELRSRRWQAPESGDRIRFEIEPGALGGSRSTWIRRWSVLQAYALTPVVGSIGLEDSTLRTSLIATFPATSRSGPIDPKWLDRLPTDRVALAFALAIDPNPASTNALFQLADQVEKGDPVLANTAPLRLRLNLLARAFGLRLEEDLFPHLKGISGWIGSDGRSIDRALLSLHLDGEGKAERIFAGIGLKPAFDQPQRGVEVTRSLGEIGGRSVRLRRENASILLSWGDGSIEPAPFDGKRRSASVREGFRSRAGEAQPCFVAAIWPSKIPGLIPSETPLSNAISEASPVRWSGYQDDSGVVRLEGAWDALDAMIGRFLEAIPLAPPTHPGG